MTVVAMYRAYIGNLDSAVTEAGLQELLQQLDLNVDSIVIKRGYGFIDCSDQTNFEQAINNLNGYSFFGSTLLVEPSSISKRMRSNQIHISNIPVGTSLEEVEELVEQFGIVQSCEIVPGEATSLATVTFDTSECARNALDQLNGYQYHDSILNAEILGSHGSAGGVATPQQKLPDFPIRFKMLVPSDFIGAIIGRKGQTIRNITANFNVRVDVHGKENTGLVEKMISIFGAMECCTDACKEILSIVQQESASANRGDVTLKLLVDDHYCGRIIGREGKGIKKIRDDTGARISISNVQEMAAIYPDRVISVRGTVDSMSMAESAISARLRECYERDEISFSRPGTSQLSTSLPRLPVLHQPVGAALYPSIGSTGYASPEGAGQFSAYQGFPSTSHYRHHQPHHQHQQPAAIETCHISIPNFAVGAIIGAAGANIKRIIRDSNALVTVAPRRDDQSPAEERSATIKGTPDACWRASYFIFEKMKLEGFAGSDGEVRLRTTITVPRSVAGRVVGKGGKNVREIQRITGAMIKLAAATDPSRNHSREPQQTSDDVIVEVYGNFIATQSAHSRIRSMVSKTPPPPSGSPDAP